MSFSGDVKEELAGRISPSRHCQLAELAALTHFCGQIGQLAEGQLTLGFQTERESVVRKGFTLLKKTFNIKAECDLTEGNLADFLEKIGNFTEPVDSLLIQKSCCQRAFLRGAFLAVGSISDPQKGYHMEFVCDTEEKAAQLTELIGNFGIEAKRVVRKKYEVVYIKEGEAIVDLLNVMEAPVSLMELENTRIYKEVCNDVNRRMNCELSNIRKTVAASNRQVDDILYIRDHLGLDQLPKNLQEMAQVRIEYPEVGLKELGEFLDPPVGKSGVNHRLRKLCEIAENLRVTNGEM